MDEAIDLLQLFIDSKIDAETFASEFITLWREFRDETEVAMKAQGLWEESRQVINESISEIISKADFTIRFTEVCNRVTGVRLTPMSKEAEIISHIMVESDAYESDPKVRAAHAQYIGEAELLTEVRKALEELKAIRSANDGK